MSRRETRRETDLSRISRRSLIGSGAAASVLAALTVGAEAGPRPGGTLRIAVPEGAVFERLLAPGSVFDCLTEVDGDGGLRGELAARWTARDAGREWVVTLRPDAAFHDGRPVAPGDVAASMKAHLGAGVPALSGVRRISPVAGDAVAFVLARPDPQFPLRLADPALVVGPGGSMSEPVGSGIYQVTEQGPGRRIKLARVDGHPRGARGGGWFDRVEYLVIASPEDRRDALLSGRVDVAFGLDPEAVPVLARHRRLTSTVIQAPDGSGTAPMLVGHTARTRGLDGRDPLRIAERGWYA